jgi:hypothetical protein
MKIPFVTPASSLPDYVEIEIVNLRRLIDSIKKTGYAKYNDGTKRYSLPRNLLPEFEKTVSEFAQCCSHDFVPSSNMDRAIDGDTYDTKKDKKVTIQINMSSQHDKIRCICIPYSKEVVAYFKTLKDRFYDSNTKEWLFSRDTVNNLQFHFKDSADVLLKFI